MNKLKPLYFVVVVLSILIGCKNNAKESKKNLLPETRNDLSIYGNYVSKDYSKRDEGYDWVSVKVTEARNNQLIISIRSRADKKRPSCTFDAVAKKIDEQTYKTEINGKIILFRFTNGEINIATEKEIDLGLLYFYCSGGASIGGNYLKTHEPLDQSQIDKTNFSKVLNLQDVRFNVSSKEKNGKNTLTILTFGLSENEYNETFNIDGEEVLNVEVEDLNSDGSPELFIYTQSVGSGSYGNVYAFSVNNKKSMSQVYFQPTGENNMINQGYMGHDEFSLIENTLGQRFPIYKKSDTNAEPTGGMRQVTYKLVEGEAMRKLVVDKILEY